MSDPQEDRRKELRRKDDRDLLEEVERLMFILLFGEPEKENLN